MQEVSTPVPWYLSTDEDYMIRTLLSANIVIMVLLFSACSGGSKTFLTHHEGDTIPMCYAEGLTLVAYPDYTVATLRNPWDTLQTLHTYILLPAGREEPPHLPAGTVVHTPLQRSVVYSSVHCSLLEQLGRSEAVVGVCDLQYINLPHIQKGCRRGEIVDCGSTLAPDVERIVDLSPDAVLVSPFENSGGYGRIEKVGIPLIECADYMETSLLGRAEWMRFYGMLYGAEAVADSLFHVVEENYLALKERAATLPVTHSLLPDLKTGSTWYMPGGCSTMGHLFRDAGGRYAFADDTHSGSVPLAVETVLDRAGDADVWVIRYHRDRDMTYDDLAGEFAGYRGLKAFRQRNVYGCNTAHVPYYEEAPFRPDYLLSDYLLMLHPELKEAGELRYFKKL